ncbi:hypothetical protein SISSUDRAFT_1056389 [Sistotremastrum suecicum HHB10207 ss-3]|uniref:Uncharacterized protein n=1 Tax=Sistotremastrum suecicum HHB10207 ss-3 TaxID=1314776 RepID=A0A165WYF9_9AGAM|nr:hypothetical protein SISSUDRAFT_1056389 [Sistotremastrum suecicum HHB10207 ss-3]
MVVRGQNPRIVECWMDAVQEHAAVRCPQKRRETDAYVGREEVLEVFRNGDDEDPMEEVDENAELDEESAGLDLIAEASDPNLLDRAVASFSYGEIAGD